MNFTSPGFCLFVILCCISFSSPSSPSLLEDERLLLSAPTAESFGKRIRSDVIRKRKRISDYAGSFDETDPRYSNLTPSAYLPPTEELKPFSTVQDPQLSYPNEPQASAIDAQAAEAPESRLATRTDGDENAKDDQCTHSFHSFLCRKPGNGGNRRLKVKQPIVPEASFPRPTKLKPPSLPKITTTSQKPALEEPSEFGATFIQPARVNPPANTPNCSSSIHANKPLIPLAYISTTFPPRVSTISKPKSILKLNDNNDIAYTRRQPTRKPIYADATFQQPSRLPFPVLDHKNCSSKEHSVVFKPAPTTVSPQLRLNHKNCSTHNPENVDVQATFLSSAIVLPPEEKEPIVPQPDTILSKQVEPKDLVSRDHPFHSALCKTGNSVFPVRKNEQGPLTGDSTFVDSSIVLPPSTTQKPKYTTTTTIRVPTTEKLIEPQAAQNPTSVIAIPPAVTNHDHDHHGRDICSDPFHSFLCQTVDPRNRRRKYGKSPTNARPTLEENNPTGDNTFIYSERVAPPSGTVYPPTTQRTKTYFQPQLLVTTTYSPPIVPRAKFNTPSILDIIPKNIYETTPPEVKQIPCDHTTPFPGESLTLTPQRKNLIADSSSQIRNKLPIQNIISSPQTTSTTTTTTTTFRPKIRLTNPPFIFHPDGSLCKNPNEHIPDVPKTLDPAASFINAENILPDRSDSLGLAKTTVRTTTRIFPTTKQSEVEPQAAQNPETIVKQNNPDHDHEHHHHHHEGDICKDPFHSFLCEPIKPRRRFDGQPQSSARKPSFEKGPALRGESSLTQTVKLPPPLPVANSRNAPTSINDQIDSTLPSRNFQKLPQNPPTVVSKFQGKVPPSEEVYEPRNPQTVILFKDSPNTFNSQQSEGNIEKITNPYIISPKQSDFSPVGSSSNQLFGSTGYNYPRPQNELNYPKSFPVSSLRRLSRNPVELRREEINSNAFDSITQKNGRNEDKVGAISNDPKFSHTTNKDDLKKESRVNRGKPIRWSWSPSDSATS